MEFTQTSSWSIMSRNRLLLAAILSMALFAPLVSAYEENGQSSLPSSDAHTLPNVIDRAYYSITEGQTRWHSKLVDQGTSSLKVDVDWDSPDNSLTLTIYAPGSGPVFGPYRDGSDGVIDSRIQLTVSNPGIYPGTWQFKVYGERVYGTEIYYFNAY